MRVNPTVTWVTREALEDVEFQGLHIPKGGIVQMLSHAAGTDPRAVPDPSFDITQQRPPHHGFGAGIHHCLGHFVARTDMAVALPLLAQRMPDAVPRRPRSSGCRCRATPVRCRSRSGSRPRPRRSARARDHRLDRRRRRTGGSRPWRRTCATTSASSCATPRGRRTTTPTSGCASTPTTRLPSRRSTGVDDAPDGLGGRGPVDRRDQHRTFIRAAADAGVEHIVYTSFAGAAPDATFTLGRDHWDAEQAIRESGMTYHVPAGQLLQPTCCRTSPTRHGVMRGPAGDGRVAAVARADVADVATAVLRSPAEHADATYVLTGPGGGDAGRGGRARRCGARPGVVASRTRPSRRRTPPAGRRTAREDWQLDAWVSTYTAIKDGSCAEVTGDVELVSGHPARTLEQALRS